MVGCEGGRVSVLAAADEIMCQSSVEQGRGVCLSIVWVKEMEINTVCSLEM